MIHVCELHRGSSILTGACEGGGRHLVGTGALVVVTRTFLCRRATPGQGAGEPEVGKVGDAPLGGDCWGVSRARGDSQLGTASRWKIKHMHINIYLKLPTLITESLAFSTE